MIDYIFIVIFIIIIFIFIKFEILYNRSNYTKKILIIRKIQIYLNHLVNFLLILLSLLTNIVNFAFNNIKYNNNLVKAI